MREVEVKASVRNLAALEAVLAARGVSLSKPVSQDDAVFVRETGSLETFLANGLFLRLRTSGESKVLFTAKFNANRNAEQDMVAEEHETEIASRVEMERILELMGFKEAVRVMKMRRSGKQGEYEFCLDDVEGLGSFIEIEKLVANESDVENAHQELIGLLSELGIDASDRFTKRYDVMMLEKAALK